MAKELTFEEQQAEAYAFLDAFYSRADFGYDVQHWDYRDVNQKIIDIVNDMGNRISLNSKVTAISSLLLTIGQSLATFPSFVTALCVATIKGEVKDVSDMVLITKDDLVKERDKLKSNRLAWAVVTQVMASEKGNIELAFAGF